MKKLGRTAILDVLKCAKTQFINDPNAIYYVHFNYRGYPVIASIDPLPDDIGWCVSWFKVVYSRCAMTYTLGVDYDDTDSYLGF